jgi:hypothetical protein
MLCTSSVVGRPRDLMLARTRSRCFSDTRLPCSGASQAFARVPVRFRVEARILERVLQTSPRFDDGLFCMPPYACVLRALWEQRSLTYLLRRREHAGILKGAWRRDAGARAMRTGVGAHVRVSTDDGRWHQVSGTSVPTDGAALAHIRSFGRASLRGVD